MIENYHPGLGDHRWPLVTHFVGCKPCGKFGDYPVERCLKQMDRAFNFGDNQILQMYGFEHKTLASRRVKRIRNETSDPLDIKDDLGLLHPSFKETKVESNLSSHPYTARKAINVMFTWHHNLVWNVKEPMPQCNVGKKSLGVYVVN
ncbi:hypothetical protein J5N97_013994 [Dioscorea zingiberensis]|uniref:Uncharacterized protein n=1 Tax=Dioscorea zingiberensis TaxID=325984 RepID=A0A9D5CUD9_9LILI|nr:hypothetical protein J5N97_013994 [Dioscorea zingiberensis]